MSSHPETNQVLQLAIPIFAIMLFAWLYLFFIPDGSLAVYSIYVADEPLKTVPNNYVPYNSLAQDEKDAFLAAYTAEPGFFSSEIIVQRIPWNERQTSPIRRFLSVEFVKYRERYYAVTARISQQKSTFATPAKAVILLGIAMSIIVFFGTILKMTIFAKISTKD